MIPQTNCFSISMPFQKVSTCIAMAILRLVQCIARAIPCPLCRLCMELCIVNCADCASIDALTNLHQDAHRCHIAMNCNLRLCTFVFFYALLCAFMHFCAILCTFMGSNGAQSCKIRLDSITLLSTPPLYPPAQSCTLCAVPHFILNGNAVNSRGSEAILAMADQY